MEPKNVVPRNELAIMHWDRDETAKAESKKWSLTDALGLGRRLVVTGEGKNSCLEYRSLHFGEWFKALFGQLREATVPAIAVFCQSNITNPANTLQNLYDKYINQSVKKIEDKSVFGAAKVERAAELIQILSPEKSNWSKLTQEHTKATATLIQKMNTGRILDFLNLKLYKEIGSARCIGMLPTLDASRIKNKSMSDPELAFRLALDSDYLSKETRLDCFQTIMPRLYAAGLSVDLKDLESVSKRFSDEELQSFLNPADYKRHQIRQLL